MRALVKLRQCLRLETMIQAMKLCLSSTGFGKRCDFVLDLPAVLYRTGHCVQDAFRKLEGIH